MEIPKCLHENVVCKGKIWWQSSKPFWKYLTFSFSKGGGILPQVNMKSLKNKQVNYRKLCGCGLDLLTHTVDILKWDFDFLSNANNVLTLAGSFLASEILLVMNHFEIVAAFSNGYHNLQKYHSRFVINLLCFEINSDGFYNKSAKNFWNDILPRFLRRNFDTVCNNS